MSSTHRPKEEQLIGDLWRAFKDGWPSAYTNGGIIISIYSPILLVGSHICHVGPLGGVMLEMEELLRNVIMVCLLRSLCRIENSYSNRADFFLTHERKVRGVLVDC